MTGKRTTRGKTVRLQALYCSNVRTMRGLPIMRLDGSMVTFEFESPESAKAAFEQESDRRCDVVDGNAALNTVMHCQDSDWLQTREVVQEMLYPKRGEQP